jgi:hypothetical protein
MSEESPTAKHRSSTAQCRPPSTVDTCRTDISRPYRRCKYCVLRMIQILAFVSTTHAGSFAASSASSTVKPLDACVQGCIHIGPRHQTLIFESVGPGKDRYNLLCTIHIRFNENQIDWYTCADFSWNRVAKLRCDAIGPIEPQYHHANPPAMHLIHNKGENIAGVPRIKYPPKLSRSIEPK